MGLSQYDLCNTCRNLKIHGETFEEWIKAAASKRGGTITNPHELMIICSMLITNLENAGGCNSCISKLKRIGNLP